MTLDDAKPRHWAKNFNIAYPLKLNLAPTEHDFEDAAQVTTFSFLRGIRLSKIHITCHEQLKWAEHAFMVWQSKVDFRRASVPRRPGGEQTLYF